MSPPSRNKNICFRPALLAHFYIGRMHSKFIVVPNSHDELNNINMTYENYKSIVEYCDKYPDTLAKVRHILFSSMASKPLISLDYEWFQGWQEKSRAVKTTWFFSDFDN